MPCVKAGPQCWRETISHDKSNLTSPQSFPSQLPVLLVPFHECMVTEATTPCLSHALFVIPPCFSYFPFSRNRCAQCVGRRERPLLLHMLRDAAVSRCVPSEVWGSWAEEVRGGLLCSGCHCLLENLLHINPPNCSLSPH